VALKEDIGAALVFSGENFFFVLLCFFFFCGRRYSFFSSAVFVARCPIHRADG
jgi:hypothetical protein